MELRARPTHPERTYSPDEFEALPQFNEGYELVDGRLVKKPLPGGEHGSIARLINKRVTLFDPDDKLGLMWFDTTFNVGTGWMPIPDLDYVVAARLPAITRKAIDCVPDLVVEIHFPTCEAAPKESPPGARLKTGRKLACGLSGRLTQPEKWSRFTTPTNRKKSANLA